MIIAADVEGSAEFANLLGTRHPFQYDLASSCSSLEIVSKPYVHLVYVAAPPETSIFFLIFLNKHRFLQKVTFLDRRLSLASEARAHYYYQYVFQEHRRVRQTTKHYSKHFFQNYLIISTSYQCS
jgi:hypothetical protein